MGPMGSKVWRFTSAPAPRCRVAGGKKVVAVYEHAHALWRAGAIDDFYLGTRSETDDTIVWLVEGVELERGRLEAVENLLARAELRAGVESIAFGPYWCGFRSLEVVFEGGRRVVQRWCSSTGRVVEEVDGVAVPTGADVELEAVA